MISCANQNPTHANGSRTPGQPLSNQPVKPEDPLRALAMTIIMIM